MTTPAPLPPRVQYALAAEADVSLQALRRRLSGKPNKPSIAARLDAAAAKLGVTLPALETPDAPAPSAR
jgi:transcriptional regulator with XRE-family HTH domain